MSKPSGPSQRASLPLFGQQQGQRSNTQPPTSDSANDDPAGVLKYLNSTNSQELSLKDIKQVSLWSVSQSEYIVCK